METTTQKLIKEGLIKKTQAQGFEKILDRQGYKNNLSYLYGLFQVEFKNFTGEDCSEFGATYFSFEDDQLNENEQNKINQELSNYLLKLENSGLITEKQSSFHQNKIHQSEYVHILQLLSAISSQSAFEEYMNPDKLRKFAEKLHSKSISTNNYYESLITAIKNGEIDHPIEFLNYCDKAITIKLDEHPDEPESYLENIHKKTSSLIPDLKFSDFKFKVVLDSSNSDEDSKFYQFVVSLKANEKLYKQKSSYHLYSPSNDKYYGKKIDQQEYYKIFNKVLADIQSPYRLHEVKAYKGNAVDWSTFGIIALTKEQADLLHGGGVYFSPSYESFKNSLTSNRIKKAITEYQEIGLLSHLTEEQIRIGTEKAEQQENYNLNDVLLCFPDVIHSFDMELANLEDPYAELIKEYSKISHNNFNPTHISDNFNIEKNRKATLRFRFNGREYKTDFRVESDWIDGEFFQFIDGVIDEASLEGKFYSLYEGGQGANIIYLTLSQYEYLRKYKLVVFADEWEGQEE